jgi:hypothetical protein
MKTKYTIKCNVTGQDLIRTPKYLREQIQKYGFDSVDSLREHYIGRVGRKLLKEGKLPAEHVDRVKLIFKHAIGATP